ncbi:hypothetical protein Tco_0408398 [Tanacetum coccineum]
MEEYIKLEKEKAHQHGTDISKITRKQSKTGKHGHEKRKSTREVKDSKPKSSYSQKWSNISVSMSWRVFILGMGLYTVEEIKSVGFGAYWAESARQIPDKGDLSAYWREISSAGDFLGTAPSYTYIRDSMLRLCHRLIACSIHGRSQAPEKVAVMDLFYPRGMDVGSINIPYLLARYSRLFILGRKQGNMISGGQFVAAAGAAEAVEDAPVVDEGASAVPAPVQAPQPPPPVGG